MAPPAHELPARHHGAALLLRLAQRPHLAADQPPSAAGGARGDGSRGQPVGRGDRQPVGQDDRERRAARRRRRQEDQGQETPCPDRYQRVAGRDPVHAADIQDRDGAVPLLASTRTALPPSIAPPCHRSGKRTGSTPLASMAPRLRRWRLGRGQARNGAGRSRHLDAGDRQAIGCRRGFRAVAAALGGRTHAGLAQPQPPPRQGLRSAGRNRRGLAHARQCQATFAQAGEGIINLLDIESGSEGC